MTSGVHDKDVTQAIFCMAKNALGSHFSSSQRQTRRCRIVDGGSWMLPAAALSTRIPLIPSKKHRKYFSLLISRSLLLDSAHRHSLASQILNKNRIGLKKKIQVAPYMKDLATSSLTSAAGTAWTSSSNIHPFLSATQNLQQPEALRSANSIPFTLFDQVFQHISRITDCMNWDDPTIHVDANDNNRQMDIIKHHYDSEFGANGFALDEIVKDYHDDSIIHKVIDDQPCTYSGREGARKAFQDMISYVQVAPTKGDDHDNPRNHDLHSDVVKLQHISINRNHAQVIWRAETTASNDGGSNKVIVGTDSFTFDPSDNHITSQTTVAMSMEPPNK